MKSLLYKVCPYCDEEKPPTTQYFHRQAASNDGLKCRCKVCVKYDRENYPPNRLSGDALARQIRGEDEQREREKVCREGLRLIKQYNQVILQAAKDAEYASKGIIIGGKLLSIPIKVCSGCEEQYPGTTDYFWADNRRKDGLNCRCKNCLKGTNKA